MSKLSTELKTPSLWQRFQQKLADNESSFEELDEDTDWKALLAEFGFSVLDTGKLLKIIKTKKRSEAASEAACRTKQIPGTSLPSSTGSPMLVLLVDVDNTLSTPNADGKGVAFNSGLAQQLLQIQSHAQPGAVRVLLCTSYMLKMNLVSTVQQNNTRLAVRRRLQACGVRVDGVLLTASPYAETINENLGFGGYWQTLIKPLEELAVAHMGQGGHDDKDLTGKGILGRNFLTAYGYGGTYAGKFEDEEEEDAAKPRLTLEGLAQELKRFQANVAKYHDHATLAKQLGQPLSAAAARKSKYPQGVSGARQRLNDVLWEEETYLASTPGGGDEALREKVMTLRAKLRKSLRPDAHRSGKEEIFRHVLDHYGKFCAYEVYDSSREVMEVAREMLKNGEMNITPQHVEAPVCPVPPDQPRRGSGPCKMQ